jgi:hypothetical protein
MLLQELTAKGEPKDRFLQVPMEVYNEMVRKHGKKIRWRIVPVADLPDVDKPPLKVKHKKK